MPSTESFEVGTRRPQHGQAGERGASLNVLLVAPQPFFEVRGTPLNVLQMCRALVREGHEVHVATYPLGEEIDLPGVTIHRAARVPGIDSVPIGFSKRKLLLDLSLALRVLGLVVQRRFDVIHALEEAVFFCAPAARVTGTPLIYDLDSAISDQLEYTEVVSSPRILRSIRTLERIVLERAACAVTVCAALTEFVQELAPGTPVFQVEDTPMPSSLRPPDSEAVQRLRRELGIEGRPTLVYTGNLESYQGIDLLMEAIPRLLETHSGAVFVLVGGRPEEIKPLQRSAEKLGVATNVRFAGRCSPDQIPEYLAMADVLLSPRTQGQNTPLKIYTYMYSGRPIVATDLPTHTQVLDASTAVLVEARPEALANGIARILDDADTGRRLAAAARARVQREYSFEAFQRKLARAYLHAASVTPP